MPSLMTKMNLYPGFIFGIGPNIPILIYAKEVFCWEELDVFMLGMITVHMVRSYIGDSLIYFVRHKCPI